MSIRAIVVAGLVLVCVASPSIALGQATGAADDHWRQGDDRQLRQPGGGTQDNGAVPSNSSGGPQQGMLPNGAPAQPKVIQLQPPFMLSPEEQARLDQLLKEWEDKSSNIKTFKCEFTRLEYDPAFMNGDPNQAKTESRGELKYAAPDKGLFHVTQTWDYVLDTKTGKPNKTEGGPGEYWTCDGKSIFQVDHQQKRIIERPIPPELQGQAITEGPLPFVFGAKAKTLQQRYFMRVITPENDKDRVWLEARPRLQKDAANYSKVELILTRAKMLPYAIQIFDPGANAQNQSRTVITFDDPSVNSPWTGIQQMFDDFARPNLFGYKHELEQPQGAPADSPKTADRGAGKSRTPKR